MCCEVLTIYEQFSISCEKLTIFLHPISIELCEQPLNCVLWLYVCIFMIRLSSQPMRSRSLAAVCCCRELVVGGSDGSSISVPQHTLTHTHIQGCNRSVEAGLWVSANSGSDHPDIQRPTTQQHPPLHRNTHRDVERTNTPNETHHYY